MTDLWGHQLEGVEWIRRHKKAALVHDTGTGKTRTAVALADAINAKRILDLCPAIACEHWVAEFERWSQQQRTATIVRSGDNDLHLDDILVVPFSVLSARPQLAQRLRQYDFDLVIIDEAHALKSRDSNRTEAAYGIDAGDGGLVRAPYVVLLTATPMPNHPAELWTHIRALRPELLGPAQGYDSFVDRYCKTRTVWQGSRQFEQIVGANKVTAGDLKRRLGTFIHRVHKRDVQKDLPPVTIDFWPVNINDITVPKDLVAKWQASEWALKRDIGNATGDDLLAMAKRSPHMATQRRLTGAVKFFAMTKLLEAEFETPLRKVISFAFHREIVESLAAWFDSYGVVTVDGSTPPAERFRRVQAFQTDPNIRLFNGQVAAAGESISLTASATMYIFENDWTPKTLTQAVGRAHRPGQTEPVMVRIVTLANSIDDAVQRTLARKVRDIELIVEAAE